MAGWWTSTGVDKTVRQRLGVGLGILVVGSDPVKLG